MSRAEALVQVIADKAGMWTADEYRRVFPNLDADDRDDFPEDVARAICEHLGVDVLRETVSSLRWTASTFGPGTIRHQQWTDRADAIATLLEAAGISRDGETT